MRSKQPLLCYSEHATGGTHIPKIVIRTVLFLHFLGISRFYESHGVTANKCGEGTTTSSDEEVDHNLLGLKDALGKFLCNLYVYSS